MKKNALIRTMLRLLALVLVTSVLGGCSRWENDFTKAKNLAAKKDRNILCVVSGSSWNSTSAAFKANIVDSKIFYKNAKDKWVLLNVDLKTQSLPEDFSLYNISFEDGFPAVFLLSQEGYFLTRVKGTDLIVTPTNMMEAIAENKDQIDGLDSLFKKIRNTSGPDKSIAINNLYYNTPTEYRRLLLPLVEELLSNDPNNKSGVVGKFEVEKAYLESFSLAANRDYDGIYKLFCEAAEKDFVEAENKQNAYYTAAFILAAQASALEDERQKSNKKKAYTEVDFSLILTLLNKAHDADPNSEFALQILDVIDSMKKAELIYNKEVGDYLNQAAQEDEDEEIPEVNR